MKLSLNDEAAIKEGCTYDPVAAARAVRFMEQYVQPSTLGERIRLLPWQRSIVENLYGWKRGNRPRYKRATISTAKKNGKTVLVSAILAYGLLGNLTPSPFVASASTSRENASQVYRELAHSIRKNTKLSKICKCLDSMKEIRCPSKASRYRAFSADAGSSEGENLSLCVVDETHAHVSERLYRSLEYSSIARPDGLLVNVSTAGSDQGHFWYEIFRYAQDVQSDKIIDTSLLPYICTPSEGDDLEDPSTWAKSNPSLSVSFSVEDFRRDYERAKAGGTADLLSFRRYRLNQFCQPDDSYIDPIKWDRCLSPMRDDELKQYPLFVGNDLSQTTDVCSSTCCWVLPERKFYLRSHAWVCEEGVRRREQTNLPKYRQFQEEKVMTITPGTCNDYRQIKAYQLNLRKNFNLKEIIFDQYNALEMCAELMGEGITVMRQPQTHRAFTSPVKEFEIAVTEQRIRHDGNRFVRWNLSNTRLDVDSYGNCKPARDKSTDKIDATISTLLAFGRAVEVSVTSKPSVYEKRGIIWI